MKLDTYKKFKAAKPTLEFFSEKPGRSSISYYSLRGKPTVLKRFKSDEAAKREKLAYDFFLENSILKVPFRYFSEGNLALYDFIEKDIIDDPLKRIGNWSRVHSIKGLANLFDNRVPTRENLMKIIGRLREKRRLYGVNNNLYADKLEGGIDNLVSPAIESFTHGDLRPKNAIVNKKGIYYIDFEFSGIAHPATDIAPSFLSHPSLMGKILSTYASKSSLNFKDILEEIPFYVLSRAARVINMQEEMSFEREVRQAVKRKLILIMNRVIKHKISDFI